MADDLARDLCAVGVAEALDAHVHEPPAVDGLAAERLTSGSSRARSAPAARPPLTRPRRRRSRRRGTTLAASLRARERAAAGERRAEEQRVLGQPAAHRLGGQPAGGVRRQVDRGAAPVVAGDRAPGARRRAPSAPGGSAHRAAEDRAEPGAQVGADGRAHPGGQRHRDRLEQQVEHRERVVGDAAVARALVAGGHPRHEQRRAAERERRVGGVERGHAAVAERRARADDPGTGPAHRRVPAERAQAVVQRAGGRDRLALAAERRAGRQVAGQQARARAACRTVRECPPGSAPPSVCT